MCKYVHDGLKPLKVVQSLVHLQMFQMLLLKSLTPVGASCTLRNIAGPCTLYTTLNTQLQEADAGKGLASSASNISSMLCVHSVLTKLFTVQTTAVQVHLYPCRCAICAVVCQKRSDIYITATMHILHK